ncbi:MAG: hypothetical protein H0V97_10530 [Actinobacteria bacterium]|nr:hypothetical protein [Actinomycetota bacterium]
MSRSTEAGPGAFDPSWGAPGPRGFAPRGWLVIGLAAVLPAAILGTLAGAAWGWPSGIATAIVCLTALAAWVSVQDRLAFRAVAARRLAPSSEPRLRNVAVGLAGDLGARGVELWVIPGPRVRALGCGPRDRPWVAVSEGLLGSFARIELEAALALLLTRQCGRGAWPVRLAAALGPLSGPVQARDQIDDDLRAVALTRYPPGLASAIARIEPARGRMRHFEIVPAGPGDASADERVGALSNL